MSDATRTAGSPSGDSPHTHPAGDPDGPAALPTDFDLLDEIGRGGMGVVYRARDRGLNREVAVKVLLSRYHPESFTARRFVTESQITAQLQHPGIPPVYRVGAQPDGRPFLVMKLIKGRTLDELLKGNAPLDRLAVFAEACQAVGYAHSRGVVHRDLKPGNIMVGAFGEVQVMDWGLAKIVAPLSPGGRGAGGEGEREPEFPPPQTVIDDGRATDTPRTEHGSIMGTPAYMAPEQAIGAVDLFDPRTDVFGLGGILCTLLTGQPPYTGVSTEATRQMAALAQQAECYTRLDASGADPDLIALCKRCLSAEVGNRLPNAGAVADAVAGLRAAADERARRAEVVAADERARRAEVAANEQAKRRRVVQRAGGIVAAVLLAGVVGTSVGLVQANDARLAEQRRADGEAEAKEEAKRAAEREQAAKKREEEQRVLAQQTRDRTRRALDAVTDVVVGDPLLSQDLLTAEQKQSLATVRPFYLELAAERDTDIPGRVGHARAAVQVGLIDLRLGDLEGSADWFRVACRQYKQLADDTRSTEHRADLGRQRINLANVLALTNKNALARREYPEGLNQLRENLSPTAPIEWRVVYADGCANFAKLLLDSDDPKDLSESEEYFTRAETELKLVKGLSPDAAVDVFLRRVSVGRGRMYDRRKDYSAAVAAWTAAINLTPEADRPWLRAKRAYALLRTGQLGNAVTEVAGLWESGGWSADELANFARIYSAASAVTPEKRTNFSDRAVELLLKAIAQGYADSAALRYDQDFAPLDELGEFQKLLADLSRKFPPGREGLPPPRADK